MYSKERLIMPEIIEEKNEEAQLTLSELQRIVMELAKKVAKLERRHASSS